MKLESVGILIDLRPMNERDAIARVFTYDYGVIVGMMRGALVAKKNRPLLGQLGSVAWNARLDTQLGVFHWDAEKNLAAPLMMSAEKLRFMNAAFALVVTLLPERARYDTLYAETVDLLGGLATSGDSAVAYLAWEVNLLCELGYALDLSRCAGCGRMDDLVFLSPRTCRAVCAECGAPYADKLYRLPLGLGLTGRLLDAVCAEQGTAFPRARRVLM